MWPRSRLGSNLDGRHDARRSQEAASCPARAPCPSLMRRLADGPSNQLITRTLRSGVQPNSLGTRTAAPPAGRPWASLRYNSASGVGSSAYTLTANRQSSERASNVARDPLTWLHI